MQGGERLGRHLHPGEREGLNADELSEPDRRRRERRAGSLGGPLHRRREGGDSAPAGAE